MIRAGREDEAARLQEIERDAAQLFRSIGLDYAAELEVTPAGVFEAAARAGLLLAAGEPAIGFAVLEHCDDDLYLRELDVAAAHQRRGIGRALVEACVSLARSRCHRCLLLTTFRSVPWNAPWYRRMGFEEVPAAAASPGLAAILEAERRHGHDMAGRVALRRAGKAA